MADVSNTHLNLISLQRLDNSISSIVDCGNVVVVYKYLPEKDAWEENDVEGTLFVYLRTVEPQHGFIIMNRLNTKNVIQPVTSDLQFQIESPFLLYRNSQGDINTIWFYEDSYCEKIGNLLIRLSRLIRTRSRKKSPIGKPKTLLAAVPKLKEETANLNSMDIMSMLTKAQEEYDKKSTDPREDVKPDDSKIVKPTPVRANGLVLSNGNTVSLSIDTLFAQVGDGKHIFQDSNLNNDLIRGRSQSMKLSRIIPTSNSSVFFDKLLHMHNGDLNHVENSKQGKQPAKKASRTRSATYWNPLVDRQTSVELVEKDLKEKLNILPRKDLQKDLNKSLQDLNRNYLPEKIETATKIEEVNNSNPVDIPILTPAMLELSSSLPNSNTPIEKRVRKISENMCNTPVFPSSLPSNSIPRKSSPNFLLSPLDFKIENVSPCNESLPSPSDLKNSYENDHGEDLMFPHHFVKNIEKSEKSNLNNFSPLTKHQLRDALCYMIQNDDKFISEIHECYLKSLRSHLNEFS